ncbi:uncharacterized protein A4U43_C08F29300 [Asparagus officinalis]|nr:uncharacterized protein A4U43_C08F29300 [Asparagus officinalis]
MDEIGVVVVNCNCFAPVPSLAAKIVNRYEFREDVRSFNLSGMGCACGPVAVGLAGDLLRVHADEVALVVSTEITTAVGWYKGKQRSMLLTNSLFRLGAAAILLSNCPSHRYLAKYKLLHVVRTRNRHSSGPTRRQSS